MQSIELHREPLPDFGGNEWMQLLQQVLLQLEPSRQLVPDVSHGRPPLHEGRVPLGQRSNDVVCLGHPAVMGPGKDGVESVPSCSVERRDYGCGAHGWLTCSKSRMKSAP